MPEFSVIIVNYNGGDYLQKAIDSLSAQTFTDFELLIVDNASSDGSADSVDLSAIGQARLIRLDDNLGFAGGNNLAAKAASSPWLALLNPDAAARPDWLAEVHAAIARHGDTTMFASLQYAMHEPGTLDGAGDAYLAYGFPWRGGFGHSSARIPAEGECFSPCGAAAIFRRDHFLEHGGFDERLFCFCEDVDLGFRMRLAGERCIFLPDAIVEHAGGGLSGRASEFSIYHGWRNRVWVYVKNMPMALLLLTLPVHLALTGYLLVRAAMTGRFRPSWKGVRHGFARAAAMRRSSAWRVRKRRASLPALISVMAWNPFLMSSRRPDIRAFRRS